MSRFSDIQIDNIYNPYSTGAKCVDQSFIDLHKAQLLMEIDRAKDWMELVREIQRVSVLYTEEADNNRRIQGDLKVKQQILDKYIETFGNYKLEEVKWMYATVRNDMEIIMPETNSYKFYKKVFNDDIYWSFSIPTWRIINLSIEVLDWSYQILSKKVIDKKVKEEKISTKTTKKWKIK